MRKTFLNGFILASLILFGFGTDLHASVNSDESASEWSFTVAPYAWLAGTGGKIVTDGVETDFDLSFRDIFKVTTGGFQLNFAARYGRFFAEFDGTWATMAYDENLLRGRVDLEIQQTIAELRGGYRLIGPEFRPPSPESRFHKYGDVALDAYLGARYWLTDFKLEVHLPGAPPIIPPTDISASERDEWIEPLVGGRFSVGLTPKSALLIDGNVGGFGVGNAADLTWTLSMLIDWRFGNNSSVALGWRTQWVEEYSGSGTNRNGSEFVTTGPIVGYVYSF